MVGLFEYENYIIAAVLANWVIAGMAIIYEIKSHKIEVVKETEYVEVKVEIPLKTITKTVLAPCNCSGGHKQHDAFRDHFAMSQQQLGMMQGRGLSQMGAGGLIGFNIGRGL